MKIEKIQQDLRVVSAQSGQEKNINIKSASNVIVRKGYSPYIGENGNWFEYNDFQKKFVDTGIHAQGEAGDVTPEYRVMYERVVANTQHVDEVVENFDSHADIKTKEFDKNVANKTNEFDLHAVSKVLDFDSNSAARIRLFDEHVENKIEEYDLNTFKQTKAFNDNATSKTSAFNLNASNKTLEANQKIVAKTNECIELLDAKTSEEIETIKPLVAETIGYRDETKIIKEQVETEYADLKADVETLKVSKQNVIADLQAIRDGAKLGSTALQSVPPIYAKKTDLPTKTSQLVNDSGFLTQHQDISGKADKITTYTKSEVDYKLAQVKPADYEEVKAQVEENTIAISTKQDNLISGTNIKTINGESVLGSGNIVIQGGGTSDYSSLINKPKINNVELVGNKTLDELNIQPKGNYIEDSNYVHTDNNFTTTEKQKLFGIEANANHYVLPNDVVQDANYNHTDNNFTNALKTKLNGLENYDDTKVKGDIANLQNVKVDKVVGKSLIADTEIERLKDVTNYDDSEVRGAIQNVASDVVELEQHVDGLINDEEATILKTWSSQYIAQRIHEIELSKFPNVTIVGSPTIQQGQISNFSLTDFLEFPFLVDFRGNPFEINMTFTTGNDVDNQQNILDSDFGLAFAIKDKHFIMAISFNGTSWATQQIGTLVLQPQITYRVRITWNGLLYKVQYSIDGGKTYINDITFDSNQSPYPKQMYIGTGKLAVNYFKGIINLNYCDVYVNGQLIWQGMDDAGLALRLALDLSNIDIAGINKIKEIMSEQINEINTKLNALQPPEGYAYLLVRKGE